MRKFLSALFKKISEMLEKADSQKEILEKKEKDSPRLLNTKLPEKFEEEGIQAQIGVTRENGKYPTLRF